MTVETDLLAQLLALPEPESQRTFLNEHAVHLDPENTAKRLKDQADQFLRIDIPRALATAELLKEYSDLVKDPRHKALGLLAEANARYIGLGEYEKAVALYDEAGQIYHNAGCLIDQAISQIGRIGALVNLGRYEEALAVGEWAGTILEEHKDWFQLAKMTGNLGIVYYRKGDDQSALAAFENAQQLYERSGDRENSGWLRAEFNRAIVLRNLGRFEDSIQASRTANEALARMGHEVDAARAHQSLALTYYVLGKYNETLVILDDVRAVFLAHNRSRDAILTELFISDCLLQLRRFEDVLEKCAQVRAAFTELGTRFEVALGILNEAVAYAGLANFESALNSLSEARQNFVEQDSLSWAAYCDLEIAEISLKIGDPQRCFELAQNCISAFAEQPAKQAQSRLTAARAAVSMQDLLTAGSLVDEALTTSEELDLPSLAYLCHHVHGQISEKTGNLDQALEDYNTAIVDLEKLRGRLMVEFRSGFIEDKQRLYEDIVFVCLTLDKPADALNYAERAKSRALLDLLAHRLDVGLHPRHDRDQELIDELMRLKEERDRLYRRWESSTQEEMRERGWSAYQDNREQVQAEVLSLEKKITEGWHQLLIRNADYARDASLWQVRVEPFQKYLDQKTIVLEYYIARDVLYAFIITQDSIIAVPLQVRIQQIQKILSLLRLNFKSVPRSDLTRIPQLTINAQGLLNQLYEALLHPLRKHIDRYEHLILVPHGLMHYLPFHAFYDGQSYLLESHEISYLPGASFLRYTKEGTSAISGELILGHTYQEVLPNTLGEANIIAEIWETAPFLELEATLSVIRSHVKGKKLIHFATHGDFRPDNPLFSGLALADGWLTTLDIFNLQLQASLVTLSACETGRNVVGGGDELLGLMRAFLSAGAASILLSLWAVEDRSTAALMEAFYRALKKPEITKGEALRTAQLSLLFDTIRAENSLALAYTHPYFWAPFILVGDAGGY